MQMFFYFFPAERSGWILSDLGHWIFPRLAVYLLAAFASATAFVIGAGVFSYVSLGPAPSIEKSPVQLQPTEIPRPIDISPSSTPITEDILRDLMASKGHKKKFSTSELSEFLSGKSILTPDSKMLGHVLRATFKNGELDRIIIVYDGVLAASPEANKLEVPASEVAWARPASGGAIYGQILPRSWPKTTGAGAK